MQKGQNYNHPVKGSIIKVQPIMALDDINMIKRMLAKKPLDYALFIIGINTNLRASDLINIKVYQVKNLNPGDDIEIVEKKTKKKRRLTLNRSCIEAIQNLISSKQYLDNDYLFKGQRGCITVPTVNAKVKSWCRRINLKGNYGSHTLRKTWGVIQRIIHKVDIPTLMVCFNHSNQKQTLEYLCIQPKEIRKVFMNEI